MKIVDYVILSCDMRADLIQQVKSYIIDWRQPFWWLLEDDRFFHQAMVKYETETIDFYPDEKEKTR